ncbi:DUF4192 domain-containing protein [Streptomyces phaeofaciens]|nr:DUF4192 domain-containing protein [Streptomyces phaeofaciens]
MSRTLYDANTPYDGGPAVHQVTLRTPAELADALPYLLGYRPEDSIVLVALDDRGGRGRFGGRARLGIPANPDDWADVAQQLAEGLVKGSERRGNRAAQMVAYVCQEPANAETGRQVMQRLEPLARLLRVACGNLDVPVIEALCISDGRFWSYCCAKKGCCPAEGVAMGLPGTSVLAAAATYAGIQVRGTLRELRARLQPLETGEALAQEVALDAAGMALIPRILDDVRRAAVADETLELAARLMRRFAKAPVVSGALLSDGRDDELLGADEAATLILGLQDRVTRDRAAEWMEGDEAPLALRLWRALARRCVGPYGEHAAAPLTLAGWVAWSSGDELEAREALAMALGADPGYLFARLLHQACNEGLDPESVRRCLRSERTGRGADSGKSGEATGGGAPDGDTSADEPCEGADVPEEQVPMPGPLPSSTPTPAPAPAGRRRRRPGPARATSGLPRPAGVEGRDREPGAAAARVLRPEPHTPTTGTTRPGTPSRGRSRPRTEAKPSVHRRGGHREGVRSDGDGGQDEG